MSILPQLLRKHETALLKTASYYVIHIVVAATVAYAVTGNAVVALSMSLLEPSVQAIAYFLHEQGWGRMAQLRYRTLLKTSTYYVMHISVATLVAYAMTGDLATAMTLSLLEPTVQMVFFYLHEKLWELKARRHALAKSVWCVRGDCRRAPPCDHQCLTQRLA